jgi:NTP pyrophosphatase (non-canonical NTP hydrolase)
VRKSRLNYILWKYRRTVVNITKANIANVSLDEFVAAVAGIYKRQDKKRSIWDIWLHTVNHAAAIGEEARKYKPGEELLQEIADFSMWLFTFVGKSESTFGSVAGRQRIEESTVRTQMTFSDIIWNKYPGVCPLCFGRRVDQGISASDTKLMEPCECLIHPIETRYQEMTPEERERVDRLRTKRLRQYATEHISDKPSSVDGWQQMFRHIYEPNLRHLRLTDIAFHLLEEVGEVSNAMLRTYTYDKEKFQAGEPAWRQIALENEIADVSSWLFTLINHLELMPEIARAFQKFVFKDIVIPDKKIMLSGIIWRRYGSDDLDSLYCPHICKKPVCKCPIWLVQDKKSLTKIVDNFAPPK